jgi:glycosyltransferase involved in cell wall biosynthesis
MGNSTTLKVSVLMPIRNGARFLPRALASLSEQTLYDWELIAILDASTDDSDEILAGWGDPRLRVLKLAEPNGISNALNRGLQLANGEIVARLDSDDECYPARLMIQAQEMVRRPGLGLLGSFATTINEHGRTLGLRRVAYGHGVKHWLVIRNQFIHSSVMIRRSILEMLGGYRSGLEVIQDYELWLRMAQVVDVDNIPEALIRYRLHRRQITRNRSDLADGRQTIRKCRTELCAVLGIPHPFCSACGFIWEIGQRRYANRSAL